MLETGGQRAGRPTGNARLLLKGQRLSFGIESHAHAEAVEILPVEAAHVEGHFRASFPLQPTMRDQLHLRFESFVESQSGARLFRAARGSPGAETGRDAGKGKGRGAQPRCRRCAGQKRSGPPEWSAPAGCGFSGRGSVRTRPAGNPSRYRARKFESADRAGYFHSARAQNLLVALKKIVTRVRHEIEPMRSRCSLLLLVGCGLSGQEQADYTAVQSSGVSSATYDKMLHGDRLSISDICALKRAGVNEGSFFATFATGTRFMSFPRTIRTGCRRRAFPRV